MHFLKSARTILLARTHFYFSTLPLAAEMTPKFLVTGAAGQVGTELVPFLREQVGPDNVIASDVRFHPTLDHAQHFESLDVLDKESLSAAIKRHNITHIVHLAALLSAVGEKNPEMAMKLNTIGAQNVLDLAVEHNLKVFAPSTIAVFGRTTPRNCTPDQTVTQPTTIYGITKVYQELLGAYYHEKFGVDYRSLRYPGIISAKAAPGGGTTDYAVEIFHAAMKHGRYQCPLNQDTELPMMYMSDCLKATWALMTAPDSSLSQRTYNVTAMSFSPEDLASEIKKLLPKFRVDYKPDFRELIARSWPASIDDSKARQDWNWKPDFDLKGMCTAMMSEVGFVRRFSKPVGPLTSDSRIPNLI